MGIFNWKINKTVVPANTTDQSDPIQDELEWAARGLERAKNHTGYYDHNVAPVWNSRTMMQFPASQIQHMKEELHRLKYGALPAKFHQAFDKLEDAVSSGTHIRIEEIILVTEKRECVAVTLTREGKRFQFYEDPEVFPSEELIAQSMLVG